MMESLPLVFRVFQILVPTFAVIILCTGLCRCFLHNRQRRREQTQLARALGPPSSVYVIPFTAPEEQQSGLPPDYALPPPYSELMAKPDYPHDPPPAYTDSVNPPFVYSNPAQITPSCPALPQ